MRRAWRRRVYGEHMESIKPIMQPGGSDSAALDNVFEAMVGVGREPAHGEGAADPRCLGRARDHAQGPSRLLQLLQLGDGALGRAGGDLRLRRQLGDRRHGPQRLAAPALHHHRRRAAAGRLGSRHGAGRRDHHRGKGPRRPGPDARRRSGRRKALSQSTRSWISWRARPPSATGSRTSPSSTASCATRRASRRSSSARSCAAASSRPGSRSRIWS